MDGVASIFSRNLIMKKRGEGMATGVSGGEDWEMG